MDINNINNNTNNLNTNPASNKPASSSEKLIKLMKEKGIDSIKDIKDLKNKNFISKFEKIKSESVKAKLEDIFEKINIQADKIGEKVYLRDILEYKKLVREFLSVATQNSHQFNNENFLDRRGRHRSYSTIKIVDRELESLTKEFIDGHIDHMGVMKKIDDIRGLLLDIMM